MKTMNNERIEDLITNPLVMTDQTRPLLVVLTHPQGPPPLVGSCEKQQAHEL